ncbi:MAG: Holliday junction branch migration protein RuvA [Candidatus Electrothrix sp. AW1]|nr:Holliday junction branch migration protein RuvA [Candidatus Electrothrix sp. AX1]MCI5182430.1 Holliday junction branch migration protein RuvA [Candidatus Electrothrix gigas]
MLASLSGVLQHKDPASVILDVQGVGYEVQLSSRTYDKLPMIGEKTFLHIHTNVREDAITLYGFTDMDQKKLFLLLIGVSGVGPKLALSILSGIDPAELCNAVRLKDMSCLTSLSGVGKKTAQRLCMELADKVSGLALEQTGSTASQSGSTPPQSEGFAMQDAASALINLGYPPETAWQALRSVQQADPEGAARMQVDELIRNVLRTLA